jgi:prepilin-type N-terminal cleavage/methylation domain-containing protein
MAHRRQSGFTLVELLVVITIIGMLMALVLPAINAVRENARRTACSNNMRQIALGMISYASNRQAFPGYRGNRAGSGSQVLDASWFVAVAPQLEQPAIKDRFDQMIQNSALMPYIAFATCPSDAPEQLTATPQSPISHLAYVVNAGRQDGQWNPASPPALPPDYEANGVFHDMRHPKSPKVSTTMKDGASNTLMLTENINATRWDRVFEAEIAFIFDHNPASLDANGDMKAPGRRINEGRNDPTTVRPRPSSHHPGGVNVAFCNGTTMFLREDIHYRVLQALMTPDGSHPACEVPGNANDPRTNKGYILNAADYTNQ